MSQHLLLFSLILAPFLCAFLPLSNSGVPMSRYESMMKLESQNTGLYNDSDKVVILTATNFKPYVVEQNHSSLVEFYNAYCGHCQRFAPKYKEIAASIWHWRDLIKVMAIDCAAEENNDICREYEVMSYPTLRYFGLNFKPSENNYGTAVESQEEDVIVSKIAKLAANETAGGDAWPIFSGLTQTEANNLFHGLPMAVKFVVLVLNSGNSTALGAKTILNFNRYPQLRIRRVIDEHLGEQFQLNTTQRLAAIDRNKNIELITYTESTTKGYREALERFALWNKIKEKSDEVKPSSTVNSLIGEELKEEARTENEIVDAVKRNKHLIYQADLEQALRNILHREIPRVHDIKGESLLALQRFMNVVQRYNPLRFNGGLFIDKLHEYVALNNQEISGKDFRDTVLKLETELSPIYSSSRFIGCTGSKPNFRGFTCSLWTLFHFLTVQASVSEQSTDPLEVLQAVHGLVKYFFGCTDCSQHFQKMAKDRKIWDTSTKDEAVYWLWEAHNVVNKRLAGDTTEDSQFPKIQFPTKESCPQCRNSADETNIDWNRSEVLKFLKTIHDPSNVSLYGTESSVPGVDAQVHVNNEKTRRKRMVGNIFSDMDMRMGMLLYGFCIVMMIAAFKMFAFKGYRKKPYPHDFLGKV